MANIPVLSHKDNLLFLIQSQKQLAQWAIDVTAECIELDTPNEWCYSVMGVREKSKHQSVLRKHFLLTAHLSGSVHI